MAYIGRQVWPLVLAATLPSCGSSPNDTAPAQDAGTDGPVTGETGADGAPDSAGHDVVHPDGCAPKTCLQLGVSCGEPDDGCGGTVSCGTCNEPETCGGGGVENQCGCTAKSCAQLGATCDEVDTGCGPVSCGTCTAPEECGGAGIANQCGCSCSLPHAVTSCTAGACSVQSCDQGWASCDGIDDNGCETNTDDSATDCGGCGQACSFANTV